MTLKAWFDRRHADHVAAMQDVPYGNIIPRRYDPEYHGTAWLCECLACGRTDVWMTARSIRQAYNKAGDAATCKECYLERVRKPRVTPKVMRLSPVIHDALIREERLLSQKD